MTSREQYLLAAGVVIVLLEKGANRGNSRQSFRWAARIA